MLSVKVSIALLSWRDRNLFNQKDLYLSSEDERSHGFRTTWGCVLMTEFSGLCWQTLCLWNLPWLKYNHIHTFFFLSWQQVLMLSALLYEVMNPLCSRSLSFKGKYTSLFMKARRTLRTFSFSIVNASDNTFSSISTCEQAKS